MIRSFRSNPDKVKIQNDLLTLLQKEQKKENPDPEKIEEIVNAIKNNK